MVVIKIVLRKDKPNKNGCLPVIMQLTDGTGKESCGISVKKIALNISVHPRDWNEKAALVKKSNPLFEEYNKTIGEASQKAEKILNYGKFTNKDNILNFMSLWDKGFEKWNVLDNNKKIEPEKTFQIFAGDGSSIDDLLTNIKNGTAEMMPKPKAPKNEKAVQEKYFLEIWAKYEKHQQREREFNTWRRLANTLETIQKFCKLKKLPLTFEGMTEDFFYDLKAYLLTEHPNYQTGENGVGNNCVHNFRKQLGAFLNWSFKKGFNKYVEFQKWETKKPASDLQYLNERQLKEVIDLELKIGSSFDITRDLWLFSAFSGMRYSDLANWQYTFVNYEEELIDYRSEKARKDCCVPLNEVTRAILNKYDGVLPKQANTKMNANIKEVLKLLKYDKVMVKRTMAVGNKDIVKNMNLASAITVHSARRSFINLMITKGVSITHLGTMVGNDLKSLAVYIKKDKEQIKKVMDNIKFFEEKPLKVA